MDVLKISPSTWDAVDLVEKYTSFIWTERYQDAGEFELKSYYVDYIRNLIPERSMIGLRDAQEVMIVDSHEIADGDGGPEITVKGRSFETFLENRGTVIAKPTEGQNAMWTYGADDIWPTNAAKALIMSHLTVCDEAPYQKVPGVAVENLIGTNGTAHVGSDMDYEYEAKELYAEVLDLLGIENAGIRNQLNWEGELKMYIYRGRDRTVGQNTLTPVVFATSADYLVDPKYLFSTAAYRNVAYVIGDAWQQRVYAPGVSEYVTGLNRRIMIVDGSVIKSTSSEARKRRQATKLGLAALAKQHKTHFLDAEISPLAPYVRGVHYNLGDLVTLRARYGITSQTMRIDEFIRTEDQEGERAYPTMSIPSEA